MRSQKRPLKKRTRQTTRWERARLQRLPSFSGTSQSQPVSLLNMGVGLSPSLHLHLQALWFLVASRLGCTECVIWKWDRKKTLDHSSTYDLVEGISYQWESKTFSSAKGRQKKKNCQSNVSNILLEAAAVTWLGHMQLGSYGRFQCVTAELGRRQWAELQRWWWGLNTPFLWQGPSQRQTKRVAQTSERLR